MIRQDGSAWGPWFGDNCVVRPAGAGMARLSGSGMRRVFYFGTDPTHNAVSVAATKGGMSSHLYCSNSYVGGPIRELINQ
jgi:hypothetical protein